ncbi:MAG: hypothetical protein AB8B84_01555 [Granulosicoccus sp.]
MADAAVAVLQRNPATSTGNFFIDEEVLIEEGIRDLSIYQQEGATELMANFFVPDDMFERSPTQIVQML